MDSQSAHEVRELRDRLARLEMMFDDAMARLGQAQQAIQLMQYGDMTPRSGVLTFRLTADAAAASGRAYTTSGRGILQYDDGSQLVDVPGATAVPLYNDHTKSFQPGTTPTLVKCAYEMSNWWILDLNDCNQYV